MSVKGFMIDVQGTLIDDIEKKPIEGSIEALSHLNRIGMPFVLVTNNTKRESSDFKAYLRDLGFEFSDSQYLDPLMVLDSSLAPCKVAAYGTSTFLKTLENRGYTLEYEVPEAVLVSIKEDFTNLEFSEMIEALLGGAKLVGMHETSLYAKNGRRYPGVGAILKMLSFATGRDYFVVGKPSVRFYEEALKKLQMQNGSITFEDIVMISDDLAGDLRGAHELQMRTVLVLSGKISSLKEGGDLGGWKPDWVSKRVGEWFKSYEKGAA